MGPWHFGATAVDRWVAKKVANLTIPAVEWPARVLTWAADEHVLGVIVGGLWLAARGGNERERRQTDHLVLSMVATAILPHLMKRLIDQKRPDRCMVHGPRRGIPRSGKPYDAFPSGHAMHVGAVASAVCGSIQNPRRSLGDLAASLQQPGSFSGALDDRRARRFGNRCPGGTMCAAAVRTPNVRRGRPSSASRTRPLSTFDGFKRTCLFPQNPTQFVEPEPRFNVVRPRGVSPTCMWTVKAPLRRGFLLGLRDRNPRPR